jgi:hypothetical protein
MMNLLAETAVAGDPMISGNWIIVLIGAIASAVVAISRVQVNRARKSRVTLEEPVPTVPTKKVSSPPSWDQHVALVERVSKLERGLTEIFNEGARREERLSSKIGELAEGQAALIKAELINEQRTSRIEHKLDVMVTRLSNQ